MEEKLHTPTIGELPTSRQLNRATAIAAGVAAVLLVTTVLPSEYGVDPTGVGSLLGLTPMGDMKAGEAESTSSEAEADTGVVLMDEEPTSSTTVSGTETGEVRLTLAPNEGTEVKATMTAGDEMEYSWSTDGANVNFELHGEAIGAASDEYTSYEKGTSVGEDGKFRAPFDGTHGWYWRNRTDAPLAITVKATGKFSKFVQVK